MAATAKGHQGSSKGAQGTGREVYPAEKQACKWMLARKHLSTSRYRAKQTAEGDTHRQVGLLVSTQQSQCTQAATFSPREI